MPYSSYRDEIYGMEFLWARTIFTKNYELRVVVQVPGTKEVHCTVCHFVMNKSLYINVLKSNTTRAVLHLLTLAVYCSWLFSLQYVIGVVFTSVVHVYTCVELHVPHSTKMY